MRKIVLASNARKRAEVLLQLGLSFEIRPPKLEPVQPDEPDIGKLVERVAMGKVKAVADLYPDAIIIGADTLVIKDGKILDKPKDGEDAKRMLRQLNGGMHKVYTGIAMIDTKNRQSVSDHDVTEIQFRKLSDKTLDRYVASGEYKEKAGAYAIQGRAAAFIERMDGDYYNVVGLPVIKLVDLLERLGVEVV